MLVTVRKMGAGTAISMSAPQKCDGNSPEKRDSGCAAALSPYEIRQRQADGRQGRLSPAADNTLTQAAK